MAWRLPLSSGNLLIVFKNVVVTGIMAAREMVLVMLSLSRLALYGLVWSTPLNKLADMYHVDAIRLANVCDEFDIPRPSAGHWQKLVRGKAVKQPTLGNDRFATDATVVVPRRKTVQKHATLAQT